MKTPKRKKMHPGASGKFGSARKVKKPVPGSLAELAEQKPEKKPPSEKTMRVTEFLRVWDRALKTHWREFRFVAPGKTEMAMVKRFLTTNVPAATNFMHADIPALVDWSVRNWDLVRRKNTSPSSDFSWPEIPDLRTFLVCWGDYLREWSLAEAREGKYGDRAKALAHGATAAQADEFVQRLVDMSKETQEHKKAARELARCTAEIRQHAVAPAERVARRLERALFVAREGYPEHVVSRLEKEVRQAVDEFLAGERDVPEVAKAAYQHVRAAMVNSVAGDGSLPRELDKLRRNKRM